LQEQRHQPYMPWVTDNHPRNQRDKAHYGAQITQTFKHFPELLSNLEIHSLYGTSLPREHDKGANLFDGLLFAHLTVSFRFE
jgi:hypothetical protein